MARSRRNRQPTWRALSKLFVAAVAAAGLMTGALGSMDAEAYQHHGFRWQRPVVGYAVEDTRLAPYAGEAMRLWGESGTGLRIGAGTDIRVVVAPLLPPVHYEGQPAQANVAHAGGIITGCEVRVDPVTFFALSERTRQAVLTHELGHCLGLDHSKTASVMQSPYLYDFSDDDRAAMLALYGERQPLSFGYRAAAPAVASER